LEGGEEIAAFAGDGAMLSCAVAQGGRTIISRRLIGSNANCQDFSNTL